LTESTHGNVENDRTILGWLLLVGGLIRMLFPIALSGMAANVSKNTGLIAAEAIVLLAIGAFFS
jgi:hypothetical protein